MPWPQPTILPDSLRRNPFLKSFDPQGYPALGALGYHRFHEMVMPEPFTEARLLTANEVADLMRVSRMTVYRLIKNGEMPSLRVGKGYRFREEDVHDYLRGRYTEAG